MKHSDITCNLVANRNNVSSLHTSWITVYAHHYFDMILVKATTRFVLSAALVKYILPCNSLITREKWPKKRTSCSLHLTLPGTHSHLSQTCSHSPASSENPGSVFGAPVAGAGEGCNRSCQCPAADSVLMFPESVSEARIRSHEITSHTTMECYHISKNQLWNFSDKWSNCFFRQGKVFCSSLNNYQLL